MLNPIQKLLGAVLITSLLSIATTASASGSAVYHVTITNVTYGINFTPILAASHRRKLPLFELGSAADSDIAAVAEGGDTAGLATTLDANPQVVDIQNSGGLLKPGQSVTVVVSAAHGARRISLAAMMLPTNDGFIALQGVRAPRYGTAVYYSRAYDAGSEPNDELCANIPGPTCGGSALSPAIDVNDEGFVHVHRGIKGIGDLDVSRHDWNNPVARISVTRVRGRY